MIYILILIRLWQMKNRLKRFVLETYFYTNPIL
jgi:hypothetical protein